MNKMKLFATLLLVAISTLAFSQDSKELLKTTTGHIDLKPKAEAKLDSAFFIPTAAQFKLIQEMDKAIQEIRGRQLDLIKFGLAEEVDQNTITFDGKRFAAVKAKPKE